MNRIFRGIRKLLPMSIEGMKCIRERLHNPGAAYLIMTPEHGNLGDHAIAQAEKKMLDELGIRYIEVTGAEVEHRRELHLLGLMNGRTILVHGGGNLGTLWYDAEMWLRKVIEKNPGSKILVLPNTLYYSEDEWGRTEKERSVQIYNSHPNLTIYAREKTTFETAGKLYRNVKLIPDMVLSMDFSRNPEPREGAILCLRSDRERTRSDDDEQLIVTQIQKLFGDNLSYRDMVVNHKISVQDRDNELKKQYDTFRKAELVVTDRLHGMIFCAITGTPCIVVDSLSPKVRGCFEWIKNLDYIKFCDDTRQITKLYNEIPKRTWRYTNQHLTDWYDELKRDILEAVKGTVG